MPITPIYGLPYPAAADPADVPTDMGELANAVEADLATIQTTADGAVPKTVVDAKGDLLVATAADAVGRLGVGANDQVLTADSAQATGVKWAAPVAGGIPPTIIDAAEDLIVGAAADTVKRLAVGTVGQVLTVQAGPTLGYATPAAGGGGGATLVTALPGSPAEGDEVYYVDSLTAPTRLWHLKYFGALAGTSKWWVVAATPLYAEVTAQEATPSAAYAALTTPGPSIALPLPGDYDVEIGAYMWDTSANGSPHMSYDVGATPAVDADALTMLSPVNSRGQTGFRLRRKTGLAAVTLTAKYKQTVGASATFSNRIMRATPLRVG